MATNIKKGGWSALSAFAFAVTSAFLFMGIQSGMAQEQAIKAADKAEQAGTITVEMLKSATENLKLQTGNQWFPVSITGSPNTNPANQQVTANPDPTTPTTGTCRVNYSGQICQVQLNVGDIPDTNPTAYNALLARIGGMTPPTIAEFIALGATYVQEAKQFNPDEDEPDFNR
jgi:hypothetical protein